MSDTHGVFDQVPCLFCGIRKHTWTCSAIYHHLKQLAFWMSSYTRILKIEQHHQQQQKQGHALHECIRQIPNAASSKARSQSVLSVRLLSSLCPSLMHSGSILSKRDMLNAASFPTISSGPQSSTCYYQKHYSCKSLRHEAMMMANAPGALNEAMRSSLIMPACGTPCFVHVQDMMLQGVTTCYRSSSSTSKLLTASYTQET